MGTRALIKPVDENGKVICTIYTQYDGYPDGLPLMVVEYLAKRRLVNGITDHFGEINGMDDLAAQVITLLKNAVTQSYRSKPHNKMDVAAGTIYVMPPETEDVDEEFIYYIYPSNGKIRVKVVDVLEGKKVVFDGTVHEYIHKFKRRGGLPESVSA